MNLPKFPQTSTNERVGVMRVATILTEVTELGMVIDVKPLQPEYLQLIVFQLILF